MKIKGLTSLSWKAGPKGSGQGGSEQGFLTKPPLRTYVLLFIILLTCAPIILLQGLLWTDQRAVEQIQEDNRYKIELYSQSLTAALGKYDYLPLLLSQTPELQRLINHPHDYTNVQIMNDLLERVNSIAEADTTYIMDPQGNTIAASNWNTEVSFVGKNFAFRPYFREAMKGRTGHYFALGTTSGKPGYYLSHPIEQEEDHHISGVIVVKLSVEKLEDTWAKAGDSILISDNNGIVFITSNPIWRFKSMDELSKERQTHILMTRQYSTEPLDPLPFTHVREIDQFTSVVMVEGGDIGDQGAPQYMLQSADLTLNDWNIHILADMKPVKDALNTTLLVISAVTIIAALLIAYLTQRRDILRERLVLQERNRATLQEAHDLLEVRVKERTADLEDANLHLTREISERRRTEKELRETQDAMIQTSKLAALGQMATGISHELNNPLAAIRNYSENARAFLERGQPDKAAGNLSLIGDLTARMGDIIKHLKVFARRTGGELSPVNLHQAVDASLQLLAGARHLDDVTVVNIMPPEDILVRAELVRLEQVILNLLRNATDAMEDQTEKRIEISVERKGDDVDLHIRDNGMGIPEEALNNLFDPFFSTKDVGQGLGLGLSISYKIMTEFGGHIRATNHPDGGATMTLELKSAEAGLEIMDKEEKEASYGSN